MIAKGELRNKLTKRKESVIEFGLFTIIYCLFKHRFEQESRLNAFNAITDIVRNTEFLFQTRS